MPREAPPDLDPKREPVNGAEVLEKNDWAGKYIPVVPVYGDEVNVEGKRHFRSLIRDAKGDIWFNVHVSKGALAKIDPKTEKVSVYLPPSNMSQIEGPVTIDYDGSGGIWAGTLDGTLATCP